ncbi:hypothetical protein CI102_15218 [Trichoderma harzianum]|uniref:Uncharacterized protein n=1 Tax=Trichoderma harzianum CBS 226.95 TaxID=983964 RepID=A0A2T3ZUM8_TRIHA|nr:hypothetical protein M431DRAFT_487512 [Trichoderma harzianum CBS 226.95]PKK37085.1 hypothetical protein CI102_15218 [Trichoderma harzianum]PTB48515.1 hypothetical protein M431DRAFT_487512 [Trichoderma harzianum CBS 226.95]
MITKNATTAAAGFSSLFFSWLLPEKMELVVNLNLIPARHHGTQTKTQSMDGNWLQLGCTGTLTRKLVPAPGGTHAAQASRGARKVPRGRGYIWVWSSGATQVLR